LEESIGSQEKIACYEQNCLPPDANRSPRFHAFAWERVNYSMSFVLLPSNPCGMQIALFHTRKRRQESMVNGIGILANVAIGQIARLNCVTSNIANVNTPGFKAELLHF